MRHRLAFEMMPRLSQRSRILLLVTLALLPRLAQAQRSFFVMDTESLREDSVGTNFAGDF